MVTWSELYSQMYKAEGCGCQSTPNPEPNTVHLFLREILVNHGKIPKISPGAYIFQRPFWRGLSTEGNLRFKIDWASLIVGRKFIVFALFYFAFESNFPVQAPRGAYVHRGDLTDGFLSYDFGGLLFGGAYTWRTWRGLFAEFYGS